MTLEQTPVRPEAIAEALRESVLSQVDPPGSSITEAAVALRYGTSRPTARLAIDRLVADGLLRREAHHSAFVPELSAGDILDLFDNRAIVESAAMARLAVDGTIPAAALAAHRALLDSDEFARHDIAFHRALVAGQPSPRLTRMHELLMGEIELCIGQVQAAHLLSTAEVAEQHQAILDAVTAGDAEAAARLSRQHILGARDRLIALIDRTHNG